MTDVGGTDRSAGQVYPHMLAWREDPADPDRPNFSNPAVRRLADEIAPGAHATDLGGTMSLNVGLSPAGLVLRGHQPVMSRRRLLAVQAVRRGLAGQGLLVPVPLLWRGSTADEDGLSVVAARRARAPCPVLSWARTHSWQRRSSVRTRDEAERQTARAGRV